MAVLTRMGRATCTIVASAIMTITLGMTAHADPVDINPHTSPVQPQDAGCGYQSEDWGFRPVYVNCSPYSVEIDVDHIFGHDTYVCWPALSSGDIPQGDNFWRIDWAAADGVINC